MRGSVIALTDGDGNLVETYSYDPFGNLLLNQTIYNPKLFIGRDDCLYDSETELYYMHARYYDPEAGRFIMKDPVSGSLGNPITQNSYIYCANDPINKIDPAGTTPQNTGLPPRYENEPQAVKWAGSNRTAFCTPPIANIGPINNPKFPESSPGIFTIWDEYPDNRLWLRDASGRFNAMGTFDSCRSWDRGKVTMGEYEITYGWDLSGKPYVIVRPKKGGKGNTKTAKAIEKGMNDALNDLYNQNYFNFNTLGSLVNDVASFMGSGGWGELANVNKDFEDPHTAFYHATIGAAIKSEMGSLSDIGIDWLKTKLSEKEFGKSGRKWTERDLKILIGTAVSYQNKQKNTQLDFYYSIDFKGRMSLGLVDVANLILATMKWESGFDPDAVGRNNGSIDVGLMQLNLPDKSEEQARKEGWFNPFKNVMRGVEIMFEKLEIFSTWPHGGTQGPPTQYEWMQASWHYQGAGRNRDKVWADMQKLSWSKNLSRNIILDWDTELCYVVVDPKTGEIIYPKYRY